MRAVLTCASMVCCCLGHAAVVLPLGDSITVGQYGNGFTPGSYRSRLEILDPSISFLGPRSDNAAPGQVSPYFAAWSGITADFFYSHPSLWTPYLPNASHAFLQVGTNDVKSGRAANNVLDGLRLSALSVVVRKPSIRLVICTLGPHKDGSFQTVIDEVNVGILGMVRDFRRQGYKVEFGPVGDCFNPVETNMIDGIHPSGAGFDAIAVCLLRAMDPLPGDVDGDGEVSVFDYLDLSDTFDATSSDSNWNPGADFDEDGAVTLWDYLILSDHFGESKWI